MAKLFSNLFGLPEGFKVVDEPSTSQEDAPALPAGFHVVEPAIPETPPLMRPSPDLQLEPQRGAAPVASPASPFETRLAPQEESAFARWKAQYAPDDSGADYDLRGAFKAGLTPDPETGHWPDTYKKPNHPTFSVESIYAKERPDLAGHWEGEQFAPPAPATAVPEGFKIVGQPTTDYGLPEGFKIVKAPGAPTPEAQKTTFAEAPYSLPQGFVGSLIGTNPKLFGDAAEGFGVMLDSPALQDVGKKVATFGEKELAEYRARVPSFTDIRTDSFTNFLSDLGGYAGYQTGAALGTSAPSLVVGGAAALATANPFVGLAMGAAGPSYIQNFGDVYGTVRDDQAIKARIEKGELTPKGIANTAAMAAIPIAALDVIGLQTVLGSAVFGPAKKTLMRDIAHGIATGAIAEGSTEGLQQVILEWANTHLGSQKPLYDQFIGVVDNLFAGALGGAAIGGGGAAATYPGQVKKIKEGVEKARGLGFGAVEDDLTPPLMQAAQASAAVQPPIFQSAAQPAPSPNIPAAAPAAAPPAPDELVLLKSQNWSEQAIAEMEPEERAREVANAIEQGASPLDRPTAEPVQDLVAQAKDLADPANERQGVWLPRASYDLLRKDRKALKSVVGAGTPVANFDRQGGMLVVKDAATAKAAIARRDAPEDMQAILGGLTGALQRKEELIQATGVPVEGGVPSQPSVPGEAGSADYKVYDVGKREYPTIPGLNQDEVRFLEEAGFDTQSKKRPPDVVASLFERQFGRRPPAELLDTALEILKLRPSKRARDVPVEAGSQTFTTAKGSTYEVQADGTTVRTKAARDEYGHEGDEGKKAQSARTYYVTAEAGQRLAVPADATWRLVDHGDGTVSIAVRNADGRWGISPSARNVPIATTPTKGALPLETWKPETVNGLQGYGKIHLGNAITDIGPATVEPTPAQAEAGNYKKRKLDFQGLPISIETEKGGTRRGFKDGKEIWRVENMPAHYGYVRSSEGKDGDQVDVFVGDSPESDRVFVIDQMNLETGKFDEHKILLGTRSETEARSIYGRAYSDGKGAQRIGDVTEMSVADFKDWLAKGKRMKPVGEVSDQARAVPVGRGEKVTRPEAAAAVPEGVYAEKERLKPIKITPETVVEQEKKEAAEPAERVEPNAARGVLAAPSFADLMEHVGEDAEGQTDIAALQELMGERFGKVAWADLTDTEKVEIWEEVTGENFDPALFSQDISLAEREDAARAAMDTQEWLAATTLTEDETSSQEGYGTVAWQEARTYIAPDGSDIEGVPAAVEYLTQAAREKVSDGVTQDRRAIFIIGYPGAGKSVIADVLRDTHNAAHMTADDAKLIIPEYDDGRNGQNVHAESTYLNALAVDQMVRDGDNIIVETLGSNRKAFEQRTRDLIDNGYTPSVVLIDVPKAIAMERAVSRFEETGRAIPAGLYDSLNPGDIYAQAKASRLFADTAHVAWDEKQGTWSVIGASEAFDGLAEDLLEASVRQPGMGGRDRGQGDARDLEDVDAFEEEAPIAAVGGRKPATEKKPKSAQQRLSALAKKLVGQDAAAWKRAQKQLEKLVAEVEADVGETATTKSTLASLDRLGLTKGRIEDAGEKIGGARKDLWKERGLDVSDLEEMTGAERAAKVTKTAVFPRPDYKALVESGVEPKAAYLIKAMYDRIPVKPGLALESSGERSYTYGKATPESYITALKALRDVVAEVKTVEDARGVNAAFNRAIEAMPDTDVRFVTTSVYKASGRYRLKNPLATSWADDRKADKAVEEGFPGLEPWQRKLRVAQFYKGDWGVVGVGRRGQLYAADLKTKEEAVARAKELYEQGLGEKQTGEPKRPHLDKLERSGPDYRQGKNVGSEDFIASFGFRGVEFGNWVASDERQKVVNLGFDALHDLARSLGLPAKAISLDGTLALAFGARGRGGKAAAHYEPGRLVVNMTKLSGAGSLAHEWGHALDHYLGEAHTENAYAGAPKSASGWDGAGPIERFAKEVEAMPPRLGAAVKNLVTAFFYRKETDEEVVKRTVKGVEYAEKGLKSWEDHKASLRKKLADPFGPPQRSVTSQIRKADAAIDQWRGMLERRKANLRSEKRGRIESDYFKAAKKLSGKSAAKGYWARPTELFARAFEAFVFEEITKDNNASQYLVQGVEADRFTGGSFKGNPYPVGEERERINAAFARLFKAVTATAGKRGEGSKLEGLQGAAEPEPATETSDFVDVAALTAKEKLGALETEMEALEDSTKATKDALTLVKERLQGEGFSTIVEARSFAKKAGFEGDTKAIDEMIERAAVAAARDIVAAHPEPKEAYRELVSLYGRQPRLGTRTSESVANQAYSTPVPLAYVASRLAGVAGAETVYEPTAGNGALLIEADPETQSVRANELDETRAKALEDQGFKVTTRDATKLQRGAVAALEADAVIANPPFGAVREGGKSKSWTIEEYGQPDFHTTAIDHAIALRALQQMKDDGRAVLLLGGVKGETQDDLRKGYRAQSKREFYFRLYNKYNVVDHFTIAGELYEKQGAGWPVDVVVIAGRGKSERALPAATPPTIFDSWGALEEKLDVRPPGRADRPVGEADGPTSPVGGRPGSGDGGGKRTTSGGGRRRRGLADESGELRGERDGEPGRTAAPDRDDGERGAGEPVRDVSGIGDVSPALVGEPGLGRQANAAGQAAYTAQSQAQSVGALVPVNMADATRGALARVAEKHGSIDAFVAERLGYNEADLGRHFSAEQIDALALAINNLERPTFVGEDGVPRGSALILGDATGIGKGRVVAGMLRYALRHDLIPVMFTQKPKLYGDMFRDMGDIDMAGFLGREPRVLMTNAGQSVALDEAAVEYKDAYDQWSNARATAKAAGRPFKEKMPARKGKFLTMTKAKVDAGMKAILGAQSNDPKDRPYDMVFTTYDQMNTVKASDTERRRFIEAIAPRALIVLDEAHEAGGTVQERKPKTSKDGTPLARNRAEFARELVQNAKAVMYSSATYAKRPDVMDLYARTDMGLAVEDPKLLPGLITKGGVPLQQVVATMLSEGGQYIRRERSFEGVSYEVEGVPVNTKAYEQFSDSVRRVFEFDLAVSEFRDDYMQDIFDQMGAVKSKDAGVGEVAANSTAFASLMHNIVGQMLLAIKADATADRALAAAKAGEKPLIGLSNTMESFIKDFAKGEGLSAGDTIDLDFGDVLARYLQRTLRITITNPDDTKEHVQIQVEQLPGHLQDSYLDALNAIRTGNYEGMPVSPIDWMRHRLQEAGLKVAELTGRQMTVDYSGQKPKLAARARRELGATGVAISISAFNSGKLDVLILNRSGSTGVSMHASEKFKDKRPRRMLLAQAEPNIDTFMQMLGRIHRTGQVELPRYSQIAADIPAEARPTAVLMKKMASLNANTTASRKSVFMAEAVDFINEYGDKIVAGILLEEPTLNRRLGWPLKEKDGKPVIEEAARKATGRLVLLSPDEQADFLDRVQTGYKDEIARLDQLGENTLEAKSVDLQAKTLEVVNLKERAGEGPFLGPVTVERISAKAQGRAMAPQSIVKAVAETLGLEVPHGAPESALRQMDAKGRDFMRVKAADVQSRFDTWIDIALAEADEANRAETRRRFDNILNRWRMTAAVAYPGQSVRLTGMPAGDFDGIVTKVTKTGKTKNPAALGAWQVTIAVPDASRQFVLPMSMLYPPGITKSEDEKGAEIGPSDVQLGDLLPKFEEARKEGRETRFVVTGNILSGYDSVRGKGQIVNYTTEDGATKPGVLMPRDFDLAKFMTTRAVRLTSGEQVARFLERAPTAPVISADGMVKVSSERATFLVRLPAGRGTGGRYYTEQSVRDAIAPNQFLKTGNEMRVSLGRAQFVALINAMRKLGALFETTQEQEIASEIASQAASQRLRSFLKSRRDAVLTALKMGKAVSLEKEAEAALQVMRGQPSMVPQEVREAVVERIEPYAADQYRIIARDLNGETLEWYDGLDDLSGTSALFDVLPDATPYLALFSFETGGILDQRIKGRRAHESVHALRELGFLPGKAREKSSPWGRLVAHADLLGMLAQSTRAFAVKLGHQKAAEASNTITLYENYRDLYRDRRDRRELLDQESVTAMVQLYVHGQLSEQEVAPVKDLLDAILSGETARGVPVKEAANPRVQGFVEALAASREGAAPAGVEKVTRPSEPRRMFLGERAISQALGDHDQATRKMIGARLKSGQAVPIPDTVSEAVLEAVRPHLDMVPVGTHVGAVTRLEPRKATASSNVRVHYKTTDGYEARVDLKWDDLAKSRALTTQDGSAILFLRFSLPGPVEHGLEAGGEVEAGTVGDRLGRRGDSGPFGARGLTYIGPGLVAHEAIHAARIGRAIRTRLWRRLVEHANTLQLLDMSLREYYRRLGDPLYHQASGSTTIRSYYENAYRDVPNKQDALDQESVSILAELAAEGALNAYQLGLVAEDLRTALGGERRFAASDREGGPLFALAPETEPGKELDPSGLYSPSLEAAKRLPQERGTPWQMLQGVLSGGSEAEIAATGLDKLLLGDELAAQWRSLLEQRNALNQRRQEIIEALPKLERGAGETDKAFGLRRRERTISVDRQLEPLSVPYGRAETKFLAEAGGLRKSFSRAEIAGFLRENSVGLGQQIGALAPSRIEQGDVVDFPALGADFVPRFGPEGNLVTSGGIQGTYKEVVVTLPADQRMEALRARRDEIRRQQNTLKGQGGHRTDLYRSLSDEYKRVREQLGTATEFGSGEYTSTHWPGITNPIAHRRTKQFRNEDGTITQLEDEWQSDAAERRRDQGTRDPARLAELGAAAEAADIRRTAAEVASVEASWKYRHYVPEHIRANPPEVGRWLLGDKRVPDPIKAEVRPLEQEYQAARNEAMDAKNKLHAAQSRVPPLTFTGTTSEWVDLLAKLALREAALNPSVSRLAWAPGSVHADRYNLAKRVSDVRYDEETGTLQIKQVGAGSFAAEWQTVPRGPFKPSDLPNVIGSELTEKLLAQPAKPLSGDARFRQGQPFKTLSNLGSVEIGGHGQKAFYGDFTPSGEYTPGIVGQRLLKLVKQYDPEAAKIEPTQVGKNISVIEEGDRYAHFDADRQQLVGSIYGSRRQAENNIAPKATYPSIPITPKLREKILQGLPMFGAEKADRLGSVIPDGKARQDLQESLQDAVNAALGIIARIAGRGVRVVLSDVIPAEAVTDEGRRAEVEAVVGKARVSATAGGFYQAGTLNASPLIGLATNDPAFDLRTSAGHEAWHHVKEALATEAEKRLLSMPSEQARMRKLAAIEIGLVPDDPRILRLDPREVEAYAFQRYRRLAEEGAGSASGLHIAIRKLFDRIIRVLRAVENALRGLGYQTYEDIFESARTGEIAERESAVSGEAPAQVEPSRLLTSNIAEGGGPAVKAQAKLTPFYENDTGETYRAPVQGHDYDVMVTKMEGDDAGIVDDLWEVNFFQDSKTPEGSSMTQRTTGDMGAGVISVLRFVGDAIETAVSRRLPAALSFRAEGAQRAKLYDKLVEKYATEGAEVFRALHAGKEITDYLVVLDRPRALRDAQKLGDVDNAALAQFRDSPAPKGDTSLQRYGSGEGAQAATGEGGGLKQDLLASAVTPGLDMSPEARKARAEAMGFDTSRVWYHGTGSGAFDQFQGYVPENEFEEKFRGAVFLSDDPDIADVYGAQKISGEYDADSYRTYVEGSAILPLYVRGKIADSLNNYDPALHSAVFLGGELVVFSPSNIRSVNAAFDPAREASPELLASVIPRVGTVAGWPDEANILLQGPEGVRDPRVNLVRRLSEKTGSPIDKTTVTALRDYAERVAENPQAPVATHLNADWIFLSRVQTRLNADIQRLALKLTDLDGFSESEGKWLAAFFENSMLVTEKEHLAKRFGINVDALAELARKSNGPEYAITTNGEAQQGRPGRLASVIPRGAGGVTNAQSGGFLGRRARAMLRRADPARVKIQDKMLYWKRHLEAQRAAGLDVPIFMDTYAAEANFHGRAGERVEALDREFLEPLVEGMRLHDISLADLDAYLYARHAPTRNAVIAGMHPEGHQFREALTNADVVGGSGMSLNEASAIIARVTSSGREDAYKGLAKIVYDMQRQALNRRVEAGLMTGEERDTWIAKLGDDYVPLRGFEIADEEADPDRPRSGRGMQVMGPESKQALGRYSKADSPVSYALMNAVEAIIRSEKARVWKTLYKNVEANPNPGFWKVYKGEYVNRFNPSTGLVEKKWRPPQTFLGQDNNLVAGKIGGKTFYIEINNSRLVRAMKGIGADIQGPIINAMMRVMRVYASLLTSWNPEFTFPNFFRDLQTALANVSDVAEKPAGLRRQILKDAYSFHSIRKIFKVLRDPRMADAIARRRAELTAQGLAHLDLLNRLETEFGYSAWFEDYRLAGGKISFMEYNDLARIKSRISGRLNEWRSTRFAKDLLTLVEDLNTAVENGVRLSTYIALRKAGVAQDRAAFVSRELTVNFNRKGEWGSAINSMYLFFNASAQGTTRMAQAIYHSKGLRYAIGGILFAALALDWWNALTAGEDDEGRNYYDDIEDWKKERNLIIVIGPGREDYIMIPLPYGYNVPFLAGQQLGAVLRKKREPLEAAGSIALAAFDSFNPLGSANSFWQYVSPTVLDPGVQMLENKTWYGDPIYPPKFDKREPDSQLAWPATPWWWTQTARFLNEQSGGNIGRPGYFDVSPETLQHYVEFAGGGGGKFVVNALQTGQSVLSGNEWIPEKTPLMRRFYGKATSVSRRREFYDAWNEVDAAFYEVRTLTKAGLRDEAKAARARNAVELKAYPALSAAYKTLKGLRKQREAIEANEKIGAPDKKVRLNRLVDRENEIVHGALKRYYEALAKEAPKMEKPAFPEPMRLGGP